MRGIYLTGQGAVSAIVAWLSVKLGHLFAPLAILALMMVVDWITGMLASKAEAIQYPDDPNYGWSSKKGVLGILKKVAYVAVIVVAMSLDYILIQSIEHAGVQVPTNVIFGLIVTIWFILNEMLSIIENCGRMGADVPEWLARYVAVIKGRVDKQGEPDTEEPKDE